MRGVRAKVVKGTSSTRAGIVVDDEDEVAIQRARASIRAGEGISMERLFERLRADVQGSTAG